MALNIVLIIAGFAALIFGANFIVDSAAAIAKRLNVPTLIIGLTIVAFGTSAPELVVNVFAAVTGSTEIAFGNILGSNIINIALILGVTAVVFPLAVKSQTTWVEIPLTMLAAFTLIVIGSDIRLDNTATDVITRSEGIILLFFFVIFIAYSFNVAQSGESDEDLDIPNRSMPLVIFLLIVGFAVLIGGGRVVVYSASDIARSFGVSERIIGLTVVSLGTSLPELATSVAAALKKNVDIAVGNIVGSNIFNTFFVLGITATIAPVSVGAGGMLDLIINAVVSVVLFVFVFTGPGRKIHRVEGGLLVVGYAVYLTILIRQAIPA